MGSGEEGGEASPRVCLARRQLPLTIEQDLTMIMALDDYCMACGVDPCCNNPHVHDQDWANFLRNYRSLGKDETTASLMVTPTEVMTTLSQVVSCVGCRRSVEALYQALTQSGTGCLALEPLVIARDGVVSVNREHIEVEGSLANLFCGQVVRLSRELLDGGDGKGKAGRRGGRCVQHSLGTKKLVTMNNWLDTWDCMEKDCREEVVLLPYPLLRQTLDGYLKKHSFCSECTNMVNRAYTLLVEEGQEPALAAGEKTADSDPLLNTDGTVNLYSGISACTADLHVHVKCEPGFIGQLFTLAEPELSGLRQERHAKTIEIAQKEVLTCIGLALFERFQRIQQKLKEGELTCDLLFLTVIKTLRRSLDMAAEKKRGVGDLELLCQEIDREEKRKEGKRERKRNRRARRKESKNVSLMAKLNGEDEEGGSDGEQSYSGDSGVSSGDSHKAEKEFQDCDKENRGVGAEVEGESRVMGKQEDTGLVLVEQQENRGVSMLGKQEENKLKTELVQNLVIKDVKELLNVQGSRTVNGDHDDDASRRKHRVMYQPRIATLNSVISLEDMLKDYEEDEEEIPQEDIRMYLDRREDLVIRRQQLRENLKARFAQLCVNSTPVN